MGKTQNFIVVVVDCGAGGKTCNICNMMSEQGWIDADRIRDCIRLDILPVEHGTHPAHLNRTQGSKVWRQGLQGYDFWMCEAKLYVWLRDSKVQWLLWTQGNRAWSSSRSTRAIMKMRATTKPNFALAHEFLDKNNDSKLLFNWRSHESDHRNDLCRRNQC